MFVDRDAFEGRIEEGGFVEHAEFLGNYYGTPTPEAPDGKVLIYEIDVQGARQVKAVDDDAVLIFLHAPSEAEQQARLRRRGDPEDKVAERLAKAAEEAHAGAELGAIEVVNHDVGETADRLWELIDDANRQRGGEPG